MGWFDDDDDDEEEDNRPKKMDMLDLTVTTASSTAHGQVHRQENSSHGEEGKDDDDDPLDAYMKSLSSATTNTPRSSMPPSARLDVENEDEATSHWQSSKDETITLSTDAQDEEEEKNESSAALHQMFHKATNQQDQRQVDIQLDKVEHTSMNYASISKNLLVGSSLATTSTAQGHEWRRQHSITCHPPLDPVYDFNELVGVIPTPLMSWIANHDGITQPTLVQSQTLAVALSGKDAIVTASTGSGKTLAYLLPLVAHLLANNNNNDTTTATSRALVLVPTRELALQVEKVAKSLLADLPFSALAITGGNMGRYQLSQSLLKSKPHLIVATPGRLLDVLSAQQKSKQQWLLSEITFLVLDEADKMLQLGFASQVSQLLENLRPDRQSLLTSATLHGKLERHCQDWMQTPTRISVGRSGISSEHVQQHVLCLPSVEAKGMFLKESLPTFCNVGRTIVFCATREGCEQLAQSLVDDPAIPPFQTLHGDKHPSDRKAALKAFTKGLIKLLIATDVAGRGLDIPQVATVINFDPAKNWDTHVHRIGRAGRLSDEGQQEGSAYTLLTPKNIDFAQQLVQAYQREGRDIGEDVLRLANRPKQQEKRFAASMGRTQSSRVGLGFSSEHESSDSRPIKKTRWS